MKRHATIIAEKCSGAKATESRCRKLFRRQRKLSRSIKRSETQIKTRNINSRIRRCIRSTNGVITVRSSESKKTITCSDEKIKEWKS